MSNDENALIENLKQKNLSTFEQIIRQHTGHLYKASLGLGFSDVESDDITQSVWITFFDHIERFEGRSTIRTFLFGILYNKASEHRKKMKRYEPSENIDEIVDSHFNERGSWILSKAPISPEKFLESSQTLSIISKCIELLPMTQKMAFMLKEIEEEPTEAICKVLNVTVTNLGVLLFRSRNQLRECLESKSR